MSDAAIPRTPVTWRDLSEEVAIIANAPGHFYPRPVPGGPAMPPDDTAQRYAPYAAEFQAWAIEHAPPALAGLPPARRDRYFPGRHGTGGPYEHVGLLLSLAPFAYAVAQQVVTWVQLGEYVARLKRKWGEMSAREGIHLNPGDQLVFAAPLIEAVCIAHAVNTYGKTHVGMELRIEATCRPEDPCTAAHPCGRERYEVQIHFGPTTYFYSVDGHGVAWEHLRIAAGSVTALTLPNFEGIPPASIPE